MTGASDSWFVTAAHERSGGARPSLIALTPRALLQAPCPADPERRRAVLEALRAAGDDPRSAHPRALAVPLDSVLEAAHTPAYARLDVRYEAGGLPRTLRIVSPGDDTTAAIFAALRERLGAGVPVESRRVRFHEMVHPPGLAYAAVLGLFALAFLLVGAFGVDDPRPAADPQVRRFLVFFAIGKALGPVLGVLAAVLAVAAAGGWMVHRYSLRPSVSVLHLRPPSADPALLRLAALGMNGRAAALGSIAGLVLLGVAVLCFTVLERNPASRAVFVVVGTSFLAFAGWLWSITLKIEPAQDRRVS